MFWNEWDVLSWLLLGRTLHRWSACRLPDLPGHYLAFIPWHYPALLVPSGWWLALCRWSARRSSCPARPSRRASRRWRRRTRRGRRRRASARRRSRGWPRGACLVRPWPTCWWGCTGRGGGPMPWTMGRRPQQLQLSSEQRPWPTGEGRTGRPCASCVAASSPTPSPTTCVRSTLGAESTPAAKATTPVAVSAGGGPGTVGKGAWEAAAGTWCVTAAGIGTWRRSGRHRKRRRSRASWRRRWWAATGSTRPCPHRRRPTSSWRRTPCSCWTWRQRRGSPCPNITTRSSRLFRRWASAPDSQTWSSCPPSVRHWARSWSPSHRSPSSICLLTTPTAQTQPLLRMSWLMTTRECLWGQGHWASPLVVHPTGRACRQSRATAHWPGRDLLGKTYDLSPTSCRTWRSVKRLFVSLTAGPNARSYQ